MTTIFARSNQLLTGVLYDFIQEYPTYFHLKSIFSEAWYNFIVPKVDPTQLDWDHINSTINHERNLKFQLSYYISHRFLPAYQQYFVEHYHNEQIGSECYVFKHSNHSLPTVGELVLVENSNIEEYVHCGKVCFPEWDNNESYARLVYQLQQNRTNCMITNYLFRVDQQIVGFGGIIASVNQNLSYFHNVGVLPQYRRRGYFTAITQHMINVCLSRGISDTYALVEENEASYHGYLKLGFAVDDRYYLFTTQLSFC